VTLAVEVYKRQFFEDFWDNIITIYSNDVAGLPGLNG
jgi:hypothetical protein